MLITLGSGPNDTDAVLVTLNGLNQYSQTVALPEGTYYCNAAVQYDALNDWPLREVDGTTFLRVEAGGQYELQYEFADESCPGFPHTNKHLCEYVVSDFLHSWQYFAPQKPPRCFLA